jgi:hypothetical protein
LAVPQLPEARRLQALYRRSLLAQALEPPAQVLELELEPPELARAPEQRVAAELQRWRRALPLKELQPAPQLAKQAMMTTRKRLPLGGHPEVQSHQLLLRVMLSRRIFNRPLKRLYLLK